MLTNSRDIKRRLEQDGWILEPRVRAPPRVQASAQRSDDRVASSQERLGAGLIRNIYKDAGWKLD
jgi:predicted RNA binding protein YcfA (HicA-like mRNA interferase family)